MKKILKRLLAGIALTLFVTISGIATIVFFPQPLFAHSIEHGNFNVYSENTINKDIVVILDNALSLVKKSELYDPTYRYDIFLSYGTAFNEIDDRLLGKGPTARATDNNVVIKVDIDATRNLAFPTFYQQCETNLTTLIAHEMIHCLQENKYGKLKFNPFRHPELWKLEGYPEYISKQEQLKGSNYNLVSEIERYIELESKSTDIWLQIQEGGCKAPNYYYQSRLMTEYLIDIKNFTYDRILNDSVSGDKIYAEMIKWKEGIKSVKN